MDINKQMITELCLQEVSYYDIMRIIRTLCVVSYLDQ